jgi:hypothetical protein
MILAQYWSDFIMCYLNIGYLCSKTSSTTFEEEDTAKTNWEDEKSLSEISESPRDAEANRYNSTIHAEPLPGQPYSRWGSSVFYYTG